MVLQLFFGRRMGVLRIRAAKFAGLDKGSDRPGALVLVGVQAQVVNRRGPPGCRRRARRSATVLITLDFAEAHKDQWPPEVTQLSFAISNYRKAETNSTSRQIQLSPSQRSTRICRGASVFEGHLGADRKKAERAVQQSPNSHKGPVGRNAPTSKEYVQPSHARLIVPATRLNFHIYGWDAGHAKLLTNPTNLRFTGQPLRIGESITFVLQLPEEIMRDLLNKD